MKTGSMPCRRCHRLKPTDITRCCASCNKELRALEQRKVRPEATPETKTAETAPRSAFVFIEPNLEEREPWSDRQTP